MQVSLQLRTGGDQRLTGFVAFILGEVLDEPSGQVLGLGIPFTGIRVGIAGIQDAGVDALQLRRNLEVEVRDLLGGGVQDVMEMRLPVPFQPVLTR